MLPTPSTPPTEDSAEAVDAHIAATLAIGWNYPTPPSSSTAHLSPVVPAGHSYVLATPMSNHSSGLGERADLEDGPDSPHLGDEDQDMSEGGAALSIDLSLEGALLMSPSHAQELNAEMDMLDAEVMGQDNLDELFLNGNHHQSTMVAEPPFYFSAPIHGPSHLLQPSEDFDDDMLYDEFEPAEAINLPTAMLEVSQQLEHLQDAPENVDFIGVPDPQHDLVADHSISPPPFPTLSSTAAGSSLEQAQENFVSLIVASSITPQAVGLAGLGLPSVPHPGGHGGWTAPPGTDVLMSNQSHQTVVSHLNNQDLFWDDPVSEADQPEVDDQFNLSLVDFLYTWGRTSSREHEPSRKSSRGPALPAILRQRSLRDLEPVERTDLQGESCDIQRINWLELGVSRLEAKQMRQQTYKNYTNLRLPAQWHVS
jgi:hypothetical protein